MFLLLFCGDIHLNPGPVSNSFSVCTLNIRSLVNPVHYTALADFANSHHIDLFALTETWISPSTTSAQLHDATPPGFSLISLPRSVSSSNTSNIVGGGTAFLVKDSCTILPSPTRTFKSFEMLSVTLKLVNSKLTVFNIYHPPPSSAKSRLSAPFSQFLKDLNVLFSIAVTTPHEFLITGDFNLHLDSPYDPQTKQFLLALDSANLTQHVHFPAHRDKHTLILSSLNLNLHYLLLLLSLLYLLLITFLSSHLSLSLLLLLLLSLLVLFALLSLSMLTTSLMIFYVLVSLLVLLLI